MLRRRVSFIAFLIPLVLLAVLVWGCGGTQSTDTSSTARITTTTAGSSSSGGAASALLHTQLKTTGDTPGEYVDAIKQGHPVVMLFYVTGGADDSKVLDSLDQLQPNFADYVFLLYDYKTPSLYGDLSTLLKVSYPPEVIMVDGTGTIQQIWNGYVDEGTLNQSLVNLGQE